MRIQLRLLVAAVAVLLTVASSAEAELFTFEFPLAD
jgi:hypothetical protein